MIKSVQANALPGGRMAHPVMRPASVRAGVSVRRKLSLIFQKPSLRTRVSFEVGVGRLGGQPVVLAGKEVGLGSRETVPDVARTLERYVDAIVARAADAAAAVVGPKAAVDAFVAGREVLHRDGIGGLATATVHRLTEAERAVFELLRESGDVRLEQERIVVDHRITAALESAASMAAGGELG